MLVMPLSTLLVENISAVALTRLLLEEERLWLPASDAVITLHCHVGQRGNISSFTTIPNLYRVFNPGCRISRCMLELCLADVFTELAGGGGGGGGCCVCDCVTYSHRF